jgi:hypothetical protein
MLVTVLSKDKWSGLWLLKLVYVMLKKLDKLKNTPSDFKYKQKTTFQ